MNHHRLRIAFLVFHCTLGLVVFVQSVLTAVAALSGRLHEAHALPLASVEAVAAVLFLAPWTVRVGGGLLLAVFATAIALHALGGEIAWTLAVYSAAVAFVMVHGPAYTSVLTRSSQQGS